MTGSTTSDDLSNGWDAVAADFIRERRHSTVGLEVVTTWVSQLPAGCSLLELGCGPGVRRSEPLHSRGKVFAVEPSPSMAKAYQERFPQAQVSCEAAESSTLFGRQFDGVLAWGLLFLLSETAQREVIKRVGAALRPAGRFLFTAPWQVATWADNSTGRESISLGRDVYLALLSGAGLTLAGEHEDEGGNHYYEALKP